MFIYIVPMPAGPGADGSDELWERGLMKFRLKIFISNTWPQFLFFLYQQTHWRYSPLGQGYTELVSTSDSNNTFKILLSLFWVFQSQSLYWWVQDTKILGFYHLEVKVTVTHSYHFYHSGQSETHLKTNSLYPISLLLSPFHSSLPAVKTWLPITRR